MNFNWEETFNEWHTWFPNHNRRPVIGITGNFGDRGCELAEGYYRSVLEAGGMPLIIPPYEDKDALLGTLDRIDALLLSGGGDINPLFLNEEPSPALHGINPRRDLAELLLTRLAYNRQIPILGICRGCQVLAAALDGSIHQDLQEALPDRKLIKHNQDLSREYASHSVQLEEGSLIHKLFSQNTTISVNSFHHQAVASPGPHLRISGIAADGVTEAIESNEFKSIVGVQWHPECFILRGDTTMMPLFQWLVDEATAYRETVRLHQRILTLDSHCDTPMWAEKGTNFRHRDPQLLVDLHKMNEGHLDASIMVAYLPQGERTPEAYKQVRDMTEQRLNYIQWLADTNRKYIGLAQTPNELYRIKRQGRKALMMGIENGYAIGKDISLINYFSLRGVVYMTLCHNGDNDICDSARGEGEHGGLSAFGSEVIHEMNRVGMMVDLSHAAETSFWQALKESRTPIVCSHSSCRALCDHPRNLTDKQMEALAEADGVMQITLYNGFLRSDGQATVEDAVRHIQHAVEVMGIDHVGIGTDFDGDGGVPGVANASELLNLTRLLRQQGYTDQQLRLLWGENFLRVMREVQLRAKD